MGTEPGTHELISSLHAEGMRVLLPVLLADNDLDWAGYGGPDSLERTSRGLLEPVGERLGPRAVTQAHAVLLPGLAVDGRGVRLGRGGGSYDRALGRLAACGAHPALAVLLYAHEVVDAVPRESHDHLVDAALTPEGVHRFRHPEGAPKE
jgi:5-formyltetrahydrofolate cyclo-ligase